MPKWVPWEGEHCSVCGGAFTAATWDSRHTDPRKGAYSLDECHERCCPTAACREWRRSHHSKRANAARPRLGGGE